MATLVLLLVELFIFDEEALFADRLMKAEADKWWWWWWWWTCGCFLARFELLKLLLGDTEVGEAEDDDKEEEVDVEDIDDGEVVDAKNWEAAEEFTAAVAAAAAAAATAATLRADRILLSFVWWGI